MSRSVCISYFRDSKSTSVFCIPCKCADNHIKESEAHCQISFVMKSHSFDLLVPNLFMHATVVELLVNTFLWTFVRRFAKAFKSNKIAFSSSTLICTFISDLENRPPVELDSVTAPQPQDDASVAIHLSGLGTIMSSKQCRWFTFSFHHLMSDLTASVRCVLASKFHYFYIVSLFCTFLRFYNGICQILHLGKYL